MTSLAEVYFGWSSSGQSRDARFYAGIEDPSPRDQQASLQGLLTYEGRPGGRPFARFRNFAVGRNLAPRESLYFRALSLALHLLMHCPEMLKIQRSVHAGNVRIMLSGRIEREHLAELQRLIDEDAPHKLVTLDLEDVRLVDREAVGFLARCKGMGIRLENCSTYVREWISREENEPANPPRTKRR